MDFIFLPLFTIILVTSVLALVAFAEAFSRWRPNPFVGHVPWYRMRHA